MAKPLLLFLLLNHLFAPKSFAQGGQYFENSIVLKNSTVGDIRDAVIDKHGFLWIAGSNGLARYDGSLIKKFLHDPKDSLSLMDNELNDILYNDKTNQLFISSWNTAKGGLSIFDLETEQFKNIRFNASNSEGLEGQGLYWTFLDNFGGYWISIKGRGLIKYSPKQDSIMQFPYLPRPKEVIPETQRANTFLSHTVDTQNDSLLWLGTLDGALLKFNLFTHQYTRYALFKSGKSSFRCIHHHINNKVYIGTWSSGFYSFDPQTGQLKKHEFEGIEFSPKNYIDANFSIQSKSKDRLYITTLAGLIEYDLNEEKVVLFNKNDYILKKFYGYYEKDKKNRVLYWKDKSVYLFDPLRQQNKFYSYGIKSPDFDFLVRDILEEESTGKLWIAAQSSEGLYRLDLKTGKWEVFPPPMSYFKERANFLAWTVLKSKTGEILVLDSGKGIYKILEKEKKLVLWDKQPNSSKYRCMIEDKQGNIWLSTYHDGVFRINPKTNNIRHFKEEFIHPELAGIGAALDLKEDRKGNIWIRAKGLKVYVPQQDTVYLFPYFFPDQKAVYHIGSLGIDAKGNVIAGSHEGALGITDADHPEKGIVEYFDYARGLKMQKPLDILLDKKKNTWLLGQGLERINADRCETQLYSPNYFSNTESYIVTELSNGTFATGDRHGINIINPDSLKVNQNLSQPYIHSFKVFDKDLPLEFSPFQTTEVYLKPKENFFSLEFSALNPAFFGNSNFQYQLEGVDPDWVNPEDRRYVAYTNVESGTYDFKLKARNNEGVWNENPSVLRIHIATPWYKTGWAYVLFAGVFLVALFYYNRFRVNRIKEKEEAIRLKELDTFKTRFYSNITHEFRTPLTVIQGMAKELKEQPEEEPEQKLNLIVKNSRSLLNLVNQMLDLSKMQAGKGKVDLLQDDIIAFLKLLVESHESYANMQQLGLQFHSEEDQLIMDFDAKKLERVIINLLSNAIKFTPTYGKILVLVNKVSHSNKSLLAIKVKDSGIGITQENLAHIFDRFHQANPIHNNQGTGIGLAMVKELVTIMGGTIRAKSKLNEGSTFILSLPIQNKAHQANKMEQHNFNSLPVHSIPTNGEAVLSENGLPIILIIEDNIDLDYYLKSCLKEQYQTLSCRNGKEGIEKALEILPDIIISDVMMPEMNGFEVCKILKEDERSSHIPIILLTAKASTEDKLMGLTQGADAYLTKPFEKEELMIRLEKLLLIRKTLQEKYSNKLISSFTIQDTPITKEDSFINKVEGIILSHLNEDNFSIDDLASELFLSRSQVHRKLKALTSMSTSIYIRSVRLQQASKLLASKELSVSEVAYQCGFKSPAYFSQMFKETFGVPPSATRK